MPNRKLPAAHLVILGALIVVPAARAQALCDRACLGAIMTRYLNDMVAHDPSSLPVPDNVKVSELVRDDKPRSPR